MGMWFRDAKEEVVKELPYSFWLREGLTNYKSNLSFHVTEESMWDVRYWLYFLPAILLGLTLPILVLKFKGKALRDIIRDEGFTISNNKNITYYKELTNVQT